MWVQAPLSALLDVWQHLGRQVPFANTSWRAARYILKEMCQRQNLMVYKVNQLGITCEWD